MYYSQNEQDCILNERIFKNKRGGVFVDVGAHNGLTINNTLFFEKELGWKGMCVEAIPDVYYQLKQNRPNAICVFGAAYSETKDTIKFTRIQGYSEMLSGVAHDYDPRHVQRIENELAEMGGLINTLYVPCFRLDDKLREHDITHIDYLSVDTEGSELNVLKGIDWDHTFVDVVDVEDNYPVTQGDPIRVYLEARGYKYLYKIGGDNIFRHHSKCDWLDSLKIPSIKNTVIISQM